MKIKTEWYAGVGNNVEARAERKAFVEARKDAWDMLKKLLEKEVENIRQARLGAALYDNTNWAYIQADANARERALLKVIDLLTIEEE